MRSSIRCPHIIGQFSDTLVKEIDMVPYGRPQIKHFGSGNKAGFTLVQLIETSNITAHFVEESDDMYLDVFSCKPFYPDTVKKVVENFFNPLRLNARFMIRQAGMNPLIREEPFQLK